MVDEEKGLGTFDMAQGNALYYSDNLDILRRYIADESVDVICLDPPFNSGCAVRNAGGDI